MLKKKQVIQFLTDIRSISIRKEIEDKIELDKPREYKEWTLEEFNKHLLDQAIPQYTEARRIGNYDGEINAYRKVLDMDDKEWGTLCMEINKQLRPDLEAKYPKEVVDYILGE